MKNIHDMTEKERLEAIRKGRLIDDREVAPGRNPYEEEKKDDRKGRKK